LLLDSRSFLTYLSMRRTRIDWMHESRVWYSAWTWMIIIISLIIDKKIHNLMSQYRVNDFCIIFIFADWWHKLHHCCNNSFKTDDAYLYFCKILKQDMNNFVNYYNLFYQKKERSLMKDFLLIDCLKCNVNYFT